MLDGCVCNFIIDFIGEVKTEIFLDVCVYLVVGNEFYKWGNIHQAEIITKNF